VEFKEFKRKLMKNPEFRREWEALGPACDLTRSLLDLQMKRGLSTTEVARRAGTSAAVVSRLVRGAERPSLRMLHRVAEALDARVVVRLEPIARGRARPAAKKRPRASRAS